MSQKTFDTLCFGDLQPPNVWLNSKTGDRVLFDPFGVMTGSLEVDIAHAAVSWGDVEHAERLAGVAISYFEEAAPGVIDEDLLKQYLVASLALSGSYRVSEALAFEANGDVGRRDAKLEEVRTWTQPLLDFLSSSRDINAGPGSSPGSGSGSLGLGPLSR